MPAIEIRALNASPDIREALSEILVEAVTNGGSVSFMHPLATEVADAFWRIRWRPRLGANGSFWAPFSMKN